MSNSVPFGFDCYAFQHNEIKFFNQLNEKQGYDEYLRFTRNYEPYTQDQKELLVSAGRLNREELNAGKQLFCGSKIQLGVTVVTNFLNLGLQYRKPNPGRSDLINGSWNGIVSGLTNPILKNNSYDIAFGNFLAIDEEMPYLKFGPFYAVDHNLVLLTGNARNIVESTFATNVNKSIWLCIGSCLILLSLFASYRMFLKWREISHPTSFISSSVHFQNFFFVYYTMILNKPSVEYGLLIFGDKGPNQSDRTMTNSVRLMSVIWSLACIIMSIVYSGELLAVILLRTDQSIDTIGQLLDANPPIQPAIRHDDFTYKLMSKSHDISLIKLHNRTKIIPRAEVYTRKFIEALASRKYALLGDDELISTIYDTYSKYFDLHIAKTTYLQFPISIMYRKELSGILEYKLRRGITQAFETGIVQRWYVAQKDAYIKFYDSQTKSVIHGDSSYMLGARKKNKFEYSAMTMNHFRSFFNLMLYGLVASIVVFVIELIYAQCN